jgi:hypothetical protein
MNGRSSVTYVPTLDCDVEQVGLLGSETAGAGTGGIAAELAVSVRYHQPPVVGVLQVVRSGTPAARRSRAVADLGATYQGMGEATMQSDTCPACGVGQHLSDVIDQLSAAAERRRLMDVCGGIIARR